MWPAIYTFVRGLISKLYKEFKKQKQTNRKPRLKEQMTQFKKLYYRIKHRALKRSKMTKKCL